MFTTRSIIYLALVFSLCGLVGIYLVLSSQNTPQIITKKIEPQISVLSLNTSLTRGQKLQLTHLQWHQLAQSKAQKLIGYIERKDFDQDAFTGAIARNDLSADAIIRRDNFILSNQAGYFAASLAKNMRAAAITVDAQSAIAGLVQPGDKIDVLFFHELERNSVRDRWLIASSLSVQTLVSNVRVMAIDTATNEQNQSSQEDKNDDNNNEKFNEQSTITLEVTSEQAQQLAVAQELGRLSLVLRGLNSDQQNTASQQTTFGSILPNYKNKPEQAHMILMKGGARVAASTK